MGKGEKDKERHWGRLILKIMGILDHIYIYIHIVSIYI